MGVVTFDPTAFVALFPEFAGCSTPQLQGYFDFSGLYCSNDICNPAFPFGILPQLLSLVTAHLAWMNAPRDAQGNPASQGQPASPLVGRINTGSEGSVSVGAEYQSSGSPSEAFFTQTKYGAEYWQATAQFRTGRYAAQPTLIGSPIMRGSNPWGFGYVGGYGRRW